MACDFTDIVQLGSTCQYKHGGLPDNIGAGVFVARITDFGNYDGENTVVARGVLIVDDELLESLKSPGKLRERLEKLLPLRRDHLVTCHKITIFSSPHRGVVEFMNPYYPDGSLEKKLRAMMQNGKLLDAAVAVQYAEDIADGLAFLHQNGLTHGNLKPSNIMIKRANGQRDSLLITDLDYLGALLRSRKASLGFGHLRDCGRYLSPEMVCAFSSTPVQDLWTSLPGPPTDIWSCGCIVMELMRRITGDSNEFLRNPNDGSVAEIRSEEPMSAVRVAMLVYSGHTPVVNDAAALPVGLGECVRRCLSSDSAERIPANQLHSQLSSISANRKNFSS
ncbi:uncharacterized protein LOC129598435 [Paramacrobiotus metropolitanus]|uniref:uncharacterized protein LOC129598435 n=1 Tax=Paramacrobiotus metropolitanus TaxID=2943436 RepID=UPI0024458449|nr:uncharacterized protein LOC129598435 [Paramacrobiotus metropolitanus]